MRWTPYYALVPANKKPISANDNFNEKEENIIPLEPIKERKFELAQDFWKHKRGTVYTKAEMVTLFWKYCDTNDFYIINKLFICAE